MNTQGAAGLSDMNKAPAAAQQNEILIAACAEHSSHRYLPVQTPSFGKNPWAQLARQSPAWSTCDGSLQDRQWLSAAPQHEEQDSWQAAEEKSAGLANNPPPSSSLKPRACTTVLLLRCAQAFTATDDEK